MDTKAGQLRLGVALLAIGLAAIVVGVLGALSVDDGDDAVAVAQQRAPTAAPTATDDSPEPTAAAPPPTATLAPTATPEPEPTATPTAAPTAVPTEPPPPVETLEEFGEQFNATNTAGDTSFAFERLHPVVIDVFGAEACQTWLEARFSGTTVAFVGDPSDPATTPVDLPGGLTVDVANYFTVTVDLTFQGSVTTAEASYAYIEGNIHWFTNCEAT